MILTTSRPSAGEEVYMVEALRRVGAHAVDLDEGQVVALFPVSSDPEELTRRAAGAIRASTSLGEVVVRWHRETDAEMQDRWGRPGARRVGRRIVVVPVGSGELDGSITSEDVVVHLVPGVAFGTAEHPTTRSCLKFLEKLVRPGDRIADIGAGSAILSIAAASLGAGRVTALERDPHACRAGRRNLVENAVSDRVEVREVEVTRESWPGGVRFDGIVANLQAEILHPLLPSLAPALEASGWILLSGLIRPEVKGLLDQARRAGLRLEGEEVEDGWWTGWLRPRSAQ
jgi:ribosomal protein L11 methyltransferase